MLPTAVVLEVQRLLAQDVPYREIARRLGISRGTVGNIASGRRPLELRPAKRRSSEQVTTIAKPKRCPECGGLVYEPCLLCAVRAYQGRRDQLRRLLRTVAHPPTTPRRAA